MTALLRHLGPVLAAVLAFASACGDDGGDGGTSAYFGDIVRYTGPGGAEVVAEFTAPPGEAQRPVVILLHQYQGDRGQWKPLVQPLLDAGYALLAPDVAGLRGEGCAGAGETPRCREEVGAAIEYLKGRQDVNPQSIGVIGASMGADLAIVATAAFSEVATAVALSPVTSPRGDELLGADITDYRPHSVLIISDGDEAEAARKLSSDVGDPVQVKVYGDKTAHGVELLDNQQVVDDIIFWLNQHL